MQEVVMPIEKWDTMDRFILEVKLRKKKFGYMRSVIIHGIR